MKTARWNPARIHSPAYEFPNCRVQCSASRWGGVHPRQQARPIFGGRKARPTKQTGGLIARSITSRRSQTGATSMVGTFGLRSKPTGKRHGGET